MTEERPTVMSDTPIPSAEILRIPTLDTILTSPHLRPMFQPIVHMAEGWPVFGYESLARYRSGNPLLDPDFLFLYAGRSNRVCDLDVACLTRSIEHGAALAQDRRLFLNIHPAMLPEIDRWAGMLEQAVASGAIPAENIILEMTEQGSVDQQQLAIHAFDRLKAIGLQLALDDVGIAYSHLALIDRINPRYLKISQHFGTGFERDSTKQKIIRNITSLARDFGAEVVLEGIETEDTAIAARDLGIQLGQGYWFGRPQDASKHVM